MFTNDTSCVQCKHVYYNTRNVIYIQDEFLLFPSQGLSIEVHTWLHPWANEQQVFELVLHNYHQASQCSWLLHNFVQPMFSFIMWDHMAGACTPSPLVIPPHPSEIKIHQFATMKQAYIQIHIILQINPPSIGKKCLQIQFHSG